MLRGQFFISFIWYNAQIYQIFANQSNEVGQYSVTILFYFTIETKLIYDKMEDFFNL